MQELVDCLEDGGMLTLDVQIFEPGQTIEIRRDMRILSNAEEGTTMTCNGEPVFDIRCCISGMAIKLVWFVGKRKLRSQIL